MMKWEMPTRSIQVTCDGRYVVRQEKDGWIAYDVTMRATPAALGTRESDLKARALCEAEEALLMASLRRRA